MHDRQSKEVISLDQSCKNDRRDLHCFVRSHGYCVSVNHKQDLVTVVIFFYMGNCMQN